MLLMISLAVPVFCRVTFALAKWKKSTFPKSTLVGLTAAIGPPLLALDTVKVKLWVASIPMPLLAVKLIGKVPEADGVPLSVPVPLWLSVKETPPGSAPISFKSGVGNPVAVTAAEPATPAVKPALFALVMAGA